MTTNLLSVIEQQQKALEGLCEFSEAAGFPTETARAAIAAGQQALEQTQAIAGAVASIYVTADGDREMDDWREPLPVGRNLLYTRSQATEPAPIGFNGLTQAETEATMSVRGLSEPAPSTAGERAATLERFERLAHRKGELWERCQGKGWPDAESGEFTSLRDEKLPALRAALLSAPALPAAAMQLADDFAAAAVNHYSAGENDKAMWQKMADARQALETKLMEVK